MVFAIGIYRIIPKMTRSDAEMGGGWKALPKQGEQEKVRSEIKKQKKGGGKAWLIGQTP